MEFRHKRLFQVQMLIHILEVLEFLPQEQVVLLDPPRRCARDSSDWCFRMIALHVPSVPRVRQVLYEPP